MCTRDYLFERQTAVTSMIIGTVKLAVDGASPQNGACFGGQVEEMNQMISILHEQATLLGILIARMEGVSDAEGESRALEIVSNVIGEEVGVELSGGLKRYLDSRLN